MFRDQLTLGEREAEVRFVRELKRKALDGADLPVMDYRVLSFFALEVRARRGDRRAALEMDRRRNS